jgi:uncharacterized membrane protein
MGTGIIHLHSLLRYLVLILLIISIVKAISGLKSKGKVINNNIEFYTLITFHIQVLIGLVLYFISPVVQSALIDIGESMGIADLRFKILEHPLIMLIAAVFVTLGYTKSKNKTDVKAFSKTILIYYGIALLLVLSRIPMDSWFFISSN